MKKNIKLVIACIICTLLCFSAIGGDFSKTSDVKSTNKVLAATNDEGVVGTANLNNTAENSAKVGDILKAPEKGWKRYDENNININYQGAFRSSESNYCYNGKIKYTSNVGDTCKFNFTGTKILILSSANTQYSSNISIKIDGTLYKFSEHNDTLKYQCISFMKADLIDKTHFVEIISNDTSLTEIDAIDIDSTGYLVDPSAIPAAGITLNKTTDSLNVGDTDTLIATVKPDNATNKKVVWSSSDEKIATVDANGKVTAISKGKATITAKVDGTDLKATCEVTVTEPSKGRAILEVVMSNNERKEYDLEMTEVNKFVDWYNGKSSPSYQIKFTTNVKPFSNRTEYLAHDKISSFQVKEYTEN